MNDGISLIRSQNVLDFMFSLNGLAYINQEQADSLKNVIVEKNDILLNITGDSIARCCLVPDEVLPARVNQHVSIIRCDDSVSSKFVLYYLQYFKPYLLKICGVGGTRNALTKDVISNLEIIFQDKPEERASVLFSLDAKMKLNKRINIEFEAIVKTLYDYWFVQFDFPNAQGKPYKSSGGKMEFNKQLKRDIPKGWEVQPIAHLIDHDKSGDWGKEAEQGNYTKKVSCIRGTDLNGLNGTGKLNPPTRYILEKNSHKKLELHDLIVEISGGAPTQSTGRLSYITEETLARFENPLICSNFCKAITLKEEKYLYSFVYLWKRLYDNGLLFRWEGKTSGIKNLLFDSFVNSYLTVIPEKTINDQFYKTIKTIQSKRQTNLLENQQLTELRDWLLPMLMNGQVSVN